MLSSLFFFFSEENSNSVFFFFFKKSPVVASGPSLSKGTIITFCNFSAEQNSTSRTLVPPPGAHSVESGN